MSSEFGNDTSAAGPNGSTGPSIEESDLFEVAGFLAVTVTILSMAVALQTWKRRWLFLQDTSVAVILGTIIGVIIQFTNTKLQAAIIISPELFYNVILPPIIFEGGLHIDRHLFKRNFPLIGLMALPGIAVGIFASAGILYGILGPGQLSFLDSLTFMSVLGATDPVSVLSTFQAVPIQPDLNEVIFGESALNDATGIIMFRLMKSFSAPGTIIDGKTIGLAIAQVLLVFILALLVGVVFGIFICLLLKFLGFSERGVVYETSVVLGVAYASFLFSEFFTLSGIITLTFAGIFVRQHAVPNMTKEGYKMTKQVLRAFSGFMETMLFCYLGFALGGLTNNERTLDPAWIFATEFAILVARAVAVVMAVPISNLFRNPQSRFGWKDTLFMWYAGLRGGVAFLLALELGAAEWFSISFRRLELGTTLMVILFSVILFGGGTARVIKLLGLGFAPTHPAVQAAYKTMQAKTLYYRPDDRNPYKTLYRLQGNLDELAEPDHGDGSPILEEGAKAAERTETEPTSAPTPVSIVAVAPEPTANGNRESPMAPAPTAESPLTPAVPAQRTDTPPAPTALATALIGLGTGDRLPHGPSAQTTEGGSMSRSFRYASDTIPRVNKDKWTKGWGEIEEKYIKPILWKSDALAEAKEKEKIGFVDPEEDE